MALIDPSFDFEDYFPYMRQLLGEEGFIGELCNGFLLLMDVEKGLITFESLKMNSYLLGLYDMKDDEIMCMLREGDLDGDGALNQLEFCILMLKLCPDFSYESRLWMEIFDILTF